MIKAIFRALLLGVLAAPALAQDAPAPCRDLEFDGASFTLCEVAAGDDLRLWLHDDTGALIGTPERLEQMLAPHERLVFAMNAGMYHPDRRPVGLFVAEFDEQAGIVTSEGPGNFGLLPNGVLCLGAAVTLHESRAFAADPPACRFATQSGPMLVIGARCIRNSSNPAHR